MSKELEKHIKKIETLGIKKDVFKTPQNYFDEFEDNLLLKISEEKLPHTTGLQTPKDYFEMLDERIISSTQNRQQAKVVAFKLVRTISTIAAMFLIYLGVSNYITDDKITFDSISENEINDWITAKDIELDENTLATIVSENTETVDYKIHNFTENELIEYLDDENPNLLYFEE